MRVSLAATARGNRLVGEVDGEFRYLSEKDQSLSSLLAECDGQVVPGERADVQSVGSALRPGKIVAIGLNYLDHITEAGADRPPAPLIFAKFPSTVIGDGDEIRMDSRLAERVDWEVELAAVIGRRARNVEADEALDHVFGYTVGNDVSARDVQFADGQWIRGKNFDTFCPLGSTVVTADEIPDPQSLDLGTRVNGETVQESNTSYMVFSVAEIIAYCSKMFTLEPGDVVLTGTPWGCGEFMEPKRSLKSGDVVEVWVAGVDTITNPVIDLAAEG